MILKPVDYSWEKALADEFEKPYYKQLKNFLKQQWEATKEIYPARFNIFKSYETTKIYNVKAVIVGQDPYPQPGIGNGFAFGGHMTLLKDNWPPTFKNVAKALKVDLGIEVTSSDLAPWAYQGVFLLNRILTVERGKPLSHANKGWEQFTAATILAILDQGLPCVFCLWGDKAQELEPMIRAHQYADRFAIHKTSHPSPNSAHKGFLFSKPFSFINNFLVKNSASPIDWRTD